MHTFSYYMLKWFLFNFAALAASAKTFTGLKGTLRNFLFFNILYFADISGLLDLIEEYCIKLIGLFIN